MKAATIDRPMSFHWRVQGTLLVVLALVAGLLAPPAAASDRPQWLVPAGQELPPGSDVVGSYSVADTLVVASATKPAGGVSLDTEFQWQADGLEESGSLPEDFVDDAMDGIGAVDAWKDGYRGDGALVGVIDTGVAPVDGMDGQVAGEVDFTGEGGGDGFGHGTYMASVIAAGDGIAPGVAPDAGVLSLKVADDEGVTDLGTVLGALQWLHGPGRSLGIRVATLAVGVEPDSPAGVILDAATAHLSAAGTIVITATGNDEEEQALSSPATSPGTLSAGALDGDDVAEFSSEGKDRVGVGQPDVLAPGVDVFGHVDPESGVAHEAREASAGDEDALERLEYGLVKGSGTSTAAALASGVAALVSAERPDLDGLEIAAAVGKGSEGEQLDAMAAIASAQEVDETARPAVDTLPNGNARPLHPQTDPHDVPIPPVVANWTAAEWNDGGWSSADWAVDRWNDGQWGLDRPQTSGWNVAKWHVAKWHADNWDAATWDGSHWNAANWAPADWSVAKWHVAKWHTDEWNVAKWHVAKWHVAKWHTEGRDLEDWDVAKWHADLEEWDVAKWHVAKWHVAKWHVAKWHVAKWHVAKWHVAKWHVAKWHAADWNMALDANAAGSQDGSADWGMTAGMD